MTIPSSTNSENSGSPLPEQAQAHATAIQSQQQQPAPVKRSSRRANTAERRATHNAVERARRETLNSRFLDLAAMLPNLAAVRRPSKSAIVNSSIALIHNQSRARIIAARELRLLNAEASALRTELNEWRLRNQLPRVEEPVRSTDFATLLAVEDVEMGEEMVLGAGRRSFDDFGGDDDEEGDDYDQGEGLISPEGAVGYGGLAVRTAPPMQYPSQQQQLVAAQQQQQQQQQQQLFEQQKAAMARAHAVQQAQIAQQQQQQARYTPPQHHQHSQSQPAMMFPAELYSSEVYQAQAQQSWSSKAINALTPPGSAHGHVVPTVTKTSPTAYTSTANSAFLGSVQQQHGGMFKHSPSSNYSDDQSDGSSHFSENNTGLDQPFSFGLSSNTGMGMNMNLGGFGFGYGLGMMQMPPSPPHTGSPGSNIQSRRQSIAVPTGGAGSNKSSPGHSPTPMTAQAYGMGLMI